MSGYKFYSSIVGSFVLRCRKGRFLQVGSFNLGATFIVVAKATTMQNHLRVIVQAEYPTIVSGR